MRIYLVVIAVLTVLISPLWASQKQKPAFQACFQIMRGDTALIKPRQAALSQHIPAGYNAQLQVTFCPFNREGERLYRAKPRYLISFDGKRYIPLPGSAAKLLIDLNEKTPAPLQVFLATQSPQGLQKLGYWQFVRLKYRGDDQSLEKWLDTDPGAE